MIIIQRWVSGFIELDWLIALSNFDDFLLVVLNTMLMCLFTVPRLYTSDDQYGQACKLWELTRNHLSMNYEYT